MHIPYDYPTPLNTIPDIFIVVADTLLNTVLGMPNHRAAIVTTNCQRRTSLPIMLFI